MSSDQLQKNVGRSRDTAVIGDKKLHGRGGEEGDYQRRGGIIGEMRDTETDTQRLCQLWQQRVGDRGGVVILQASWLCKTCVYWDQHTASVLLHSFNREARAQGLIKAKAVTTSIKRVKVQKLGSCHGRDF